MLINLILHANMRGRAWPTEELIAKETGYGEPIVSFAIQWLFDHGAIYNVPYKYRVGVEAEMEPRKYVYQLTGVIRFDDQLVPYLYLPDPEADLARTLKELAELGGEALVKFLSQVSESEGSESKGSESEHKDSKDSKGGTLKDSNSPVPGDDGDVYLRNLPAGALPDQPIPTGEEDQDFDPDQWTLFEKWVMAATNKQTLTDAQRAYFHRHVPYLRDREQVVSPTVNEAYERWEEYREFVKDVIWIDV